MRGKKGTVTLAGRFGDDEPSRKMLSSDRQACDTAPQQLVHSGFLTVILPKCIRTHRLQVYRIRGLEQHWRTQVLQCMIQDLPYNAR